jgi:hypothetical protein
MATRITRKSATAAEKPAEKRAADAAASLASSQAASGRVTPRKAKKVDHVDEMSQGSDQFSSEDEPEVEPEVEPEPDNITLAQAPLQQLAAKQQKSAKQASGGLVLPDYNLENVAKDLAELKGDKAPFKLYAKDDEWMDRIMIPEILIGPDAKATRPRRASRGLARRCVVMSSL